MKQLITILVIIVMMFAASAQTRNLVTLSHGHLLTFFDNENALEDAVEAAVDGDVIYLSEGEFGKENTSINVHKKNIKIVGSGRNSNVLCGILYGSAISCESFQMYGITFSPSDGNMNREDYPINNLMVSCCYIKYAYVSNNTKAVFDRCYIEEYSGGDVIADAHVINSKIGLFQCASTIVDNCHIKTLYHCYGIFYNSIIESIINQNGVFESCMIGEMRVQPDKMYNCYLEPNALLDDNLECTISDMSPYLGNDGTVIGIYGGLGKPYTENPAVPIIDFSKSSIEHDKDRKQLNVTMTVTSN